VISTSNPQRPEVDKRLKRICSTAKFFAVLQFIVAFFMLYLGVNMAYDFSNSYIFGILVSQAAPMFIIIGSTMLVTGIIVILSAKKLLSHPIEHKKWGLIILVSFLAGWGIFAFLPDGWYIILPALIGIFSGAEAIAYKP
jgi:hypothetical protein